MKKDNPIPDQLAIFADRLRQVCRGHRTACACDGPPGVGKTHTLRTVTAQEGKPYRLVSTTPGGLVQMLYRYRDTPVVAFDDFDKALRSESTANVVKQMTAPEPIRRITHQTVTAINNAARNNPKDHIAPPQFNVRAGLVMLTNVNMADPKVVDRAMREHVKALSDRGLEFIHISRDPNHIVDYVANLGMTIFPKVEKDVVKEVVDYFVENGHRFQTVSVRRLESIMKDRLTMPDRWKHLQAASFVSEPQPEPILTPKQRKAVEADIESLLTASPRRRSQDTKPKAKPMSDAAKQRMAVKLTALQEAKIHQKETY